MPYQTIIVEQQGGVGIITFNRPERLNALSLALNEELDQALTQFENDDTVKAIVVTGAGRAFSAGYDIHEMINRSPEDEEQRQHTGSRRIERDWHLAACKKPTIGAINGLAYGGGAIMTSFFDIRVGCEKTSFRFLAVTYGGAAATWSLPLQIGWPMAKEILFTGRLVEAEEAFRIGLLNRIVPSSQLISAAVEIGQTIADNPAEAVQGTKDLLIRHLGATWHEMQQNENQRSAPVRSFTSPQERFKNFLERKGYSSPKKEQGG